MRLTQRANLWLAGGIAYVIYLVATIPAEIGASVIAQRSAGRLILLGTKGSVWNGSAQELRLTQAPFQETIRGIRWNISVFRLLRAQLVAQISFEQDSHIWIAFGPRSIIIRDAAIKLPASMLSFVAPNISRWRPDGRLLLTTPYFSMRSNRLDGQASVVWRDAASALSPVRPLGDYSATITGSAQGAKLDIATLAGPLHLTGHGVWRNTHDWQFQGKAHTAGRQTALADLLRLFGPGRTPDVSEFRLHSSSLPH